MFVPFAQKNGGKIKIRYNVPTVRNGFMLLP